ncbi:hypothetical protein D3C77_443520 [compost metagenome]
MPAKVSAFGIALTGPAPISSGSTPLSAKERKVASGVNPPASARSLLITITAAAPSLICELLPAVTVPPRLKLGFSPASASIVVSARTPSSWSNVKVVL